MATGKNSSVCLALMFYAGERLERIREMSLHEYRSFNIIGFVGLDGVGGRIPPNSLLSMVVTTGNDLKSGYPHVFRATKTTGGLRLLGGDDVNIPVELIRRLCKANMERIPRIRSGDLVRVELFKLDRVNLGG